MYGMEYIVVIIVSWFYLHFDKSRLVVVAKFIRFSSCVHISRLKTLKFVVYFADLSSYQDNRIMQV